MMSCADRPLQEKPGQTLQATALVHEAYLKVAGADGSRQWRDAGHFFRAAGEAMRHILVDRARQQQSLKRGGAEASQINRAWPPFFPYASLAFRFSIHRRSQQVH
jgi:hypothetical protein